MSHVVITGVPAGASSAGASGPPTRMEINDFIKDKDQFSLYIQALQRMFKGPQSQSTSHFQLGGIHGLPYVQWEGSGGDKPESQAWGGYCTHGCTLFPTWHRPYVTLYEQVLQKNAADIASTYTNNTAHWQQVAANLRAPYWDWASNSVPPKEITTDAKVPITAPDGSTQQVDNPLLGYPFNPVDGTFPTPYSHWHKTLRHPTSTNSNATSNVDEMISDLQNEQQDIRTKTLRLLTLVNSWPAFSNHSPDDGGSGSNSLEAIHDGIHDDVGARGHMGDPAVAGLDPIFFLHHCNVDRLLALWQAIHPDVWVASGPAEGGTFTMASDATQDANTNLTPFWSGPQAYWNSNSVRNWWQTFNYTYPEFAGLNMNDRDAVKQAISVKVVQMYSFRLPPIRPAPTPAPAPSTPAQPAPPAAPPAQPPAHTTPTPSAPSGHGQGHPSHPHHHWFDFLTDGLAKLDITPPHQLVALAQRDQPHVGSGPGPQVHLATPQARPQPQSQGSNVDVHVASAPPSTIYDWSVHIQCKKYELKESFAILVFLGPVPDDPAQWRRAKSYVGAHHIFANSALEKCENCTNRREMDVEGFVHVNDYIAHFHPELGALDEKNVEPYLKQNLNWRVQKADRSGVDTAQLSSLKVSVVAVPLTLPAGHVFPILQGQLRHHHSITHGKVGGWAA